MKGALQLESPRRFSFIGYPYLVFMRNIENQALREKIVILRTQIKLRLYMLLGNTTSLVSMFRMFKPVGRSWPEDYNASLKLR